MDEARAQQLAGEGWVRRFTASGPRLEEMAQAYREIGLEVRVEPVTVDGMPYDACRECFLVQSGLLFTVYTRQAPPPQRSAPTPRD